MKLDTVSLEGASLLSNYIRRSSVTGYEKCAGDYFAGLCSSKGLVIKILNDQGASFNFCASLYPLDGGKPNIVLLHHIDVIQATDSSSWHYPPFSGAIVQDTVWGRGALDMKEVAVMQLLAVSSFVDTAYKTDLPFNVTLLCVTGEEKGGILGAKRVSEEFLDLINPVVVLGEGGIGMVNVFTRYPERGVFCVSLNDKRAVWLKLHLRHETSGHSAIPPPEYTNKMMITALHRLSGIKPAIHFSELTKKMFNSYGEEVGGIAGFMLKSPSLFKIFLAPRLRKDPVLLSTVTNTMTITNISNNETDVNQIAQDINVLIDCRLLPETSTEDFIKLIRRRINNKEIELTVQAATDAAGSSDRNLFYTILEKSLRETYPESAVFPVLFPATTDNNYFRRFNVPVFGIIPVCLNTRLFSTIHSTSERIPVNALGRGTLVYSRFLEKLLFPGN